MELLVGHTGVYVWYTFSFIIFLGLLLKYGMPTLNALLDSRIDEIKKELETAENLRVEAQEMLAQYQRKHRDAMKEAEKIVKNAKESAKKLQVQAEAELAESMARREQQLVDRLKRMEEESINEIKAYAAQLAMRAAQQIITEKLDKKTNAKLLEKSIEDVHTNIH